MARIVKRKRTAKRAVKASRGKAVKNRWRVEDAYVHSNEMVVRYDNLAQGAKYKERLINVSTKNGRGTVTYFPNRDRVKNKKTFQVTFKPSTVGKLYKVAERYL